MARSAQDGSEAQRMIQFQMDPQTAISGGTLVATVVLVILTFVLLRHTKSLAVASQELTEATNRLTKIQVRPKVVLANRPHYEGGQGGLVIDFINKGIGSALGVKLSGRVGDSPHFEVEKVVAGERNLVPITGGLSFEIQGSIVKSLPLELTVAYTDIVGTKYEENIPESLTT